MRHGAAAEFHVDGVEGPVGPEPPAVAPTIGPARQRTAAEGRWLQRVNGGCARRNARALALEPPTAAAGDAR